MIDRGLRYLLHEHRPSSTDPGRCAVCLSPLDCAPHLPVAPSPTWTALTLAYRSGMTSYNPRLLERQSIARARARAAGQGER